MQCSYTRWQQMAIKQTKKGNRVENHQNAEKWLKSTNSKINIYFFKSQKFQVPSGTFVISCHLQTKMITATRASHAKQLTSTENRNTSRCYFNWLSFFQTRAASADKSCQRWGWSSCEPTTFPFCTQEVMTITLRLTGARSKRDINNEARRLQTGLRMGKKKNKQKNKKNHPERKSEVETTARK